ncbi:MAG: Gfo/Idh/MocA family protein [Solirubrobacteraceae bacterium]
MAESAVAAAPISVLRRPAAPRPRPVKVAVIGFGYWGPNLVRNVVERPDLELAGLCELERARAVEFSHRYPGVPIRSNLDRLLDDPEIEAVAIATPPQTHHEIARRALSAGKHTLVEKPLAATPTQAEDLVALAEQVGCVLMAGHTFVYSPPVNKVRELIRSGQLGDIYFVTSSRMNLGLYQNNGVISDLAPHDISILLYWLAQPVVSVAAAGQSIFQHGVPETAFLTLTFAGGVTASVQLSWLAPRKLRQTVVVGSQRMVQYEDTSEDEAVRVYDRGLEFSAPEAPATFGEYRLTYRTGDMVAPRIETAEPLSLELADFGRCIRTGEQPRSSAAFGLEIVRVLDAASNSMRRGGAPVTLAPSSDWITSEPARQCRPSRSM